MHFLYQLTQHVENVMYFTYSVTENFYGNDEMSYTVSENLINIQVCYVEEENGENVCFDKNVLDNHSDGNHVTVGLLKSLGVNNVNNTSESDRKLFFEF